VTFNSLEFAALMAVVLLLGWSRRLVLQNAALLAASYFFYGYWDIRFLALVCVSTYVDFVSAQLIADARALGRRLWLANAYVVGCVTAFATLAPSFTAVVARAASQDWTASRVGPLLLTILLVAVVTVCVRVAPKWPEARRKRVFLGFSLAANLGLLALFKYLNFFIDSGAALLSQLGMNVTSERLSLVLPVGLSFYTFQTLSYTIDVYRGELAPTRSLLNFCVFVAYFPQLVAGPIVRAGSLLPQLERSRSFAWGNLARGAPLVLVGLMKKMALADAVAPCVDAVFSAPGATSSVNVVTATVLFAIQIVCDFSGYSDVARGTSRMLGVELPVNFELPYLARNPQEFWQRWHISLSTWLRDYLYIPLGGNRAGAGKAYRNAMITMLLGGLWHGAAWHFVAWGAFHGGAIGVHRWVQPFLKRITFLRTRLGRLGSTSVFFAVTCYGWLLFRARSLSDVGVLTRAVVEFPIHPGQFTLQRPAAAFFLALPVLGAFLWLRSSVAEKLWRFAVVRGATYASMVLAILIAAGQDAPPDFIYFQF